MEAMMMRPHFSGRSKPLRYIFYAGGASPSPTYLQNSAVHNVGATIGRPFAQLNVEVFIRRSQACRIFRSIRKNFQGAAAVKLFRRRGRKIGLGEAVLTYGEVKPVAPSEAYGRIFKAD